MSIHRHRRLTRTSSDRFMDGIANGSADATTPLTELLRAAMAVPDAHEELAGEADALAALRAARRAAPTELSARARKSLISMVLTVKAATIMAAIVTAGGVAVAASVGAIPTPLRGTQPHASITTTGSTSGPGPKPGASSSALTPGSSSSATIHPTPSASPTRTLAELCHSYVKLDANDRVKALRSEAYQPLVTAAGGSDHVADFCAQFEPAPTTSSSTSKSKDKHPSGSPKPTGTHTSPEPQPKTGKPAGMSTPHPDR